MNDLISRESLKQRINLNYSSHQYIDAQAMKDIIDTEPTVEDKTVEELEKIREDIENIRDWVGGTRRYFSEDELNEIFDKHISKLKGENNANSNL